MTAESAQIAFMVLFVIACCIWMLSLWFSLRIGECRQSMWQDYEKFHGPSGEVDCAISWEEFAPRIKKALRYQAMSVSTIKFTVSDESEKSLTFERLGPIVCNLPTGLMFSSLNIKMAEQNGKQVLRYQLNQGTIYEIFKKIALAICLFLGIPALMVLSAVIWYFCVKSENAGVRGQVFQMLQISHVLWPPFLFVMVSQQMRGGVKLFLENILEHVADPNVSDDELSVSFVMGKPRVSHQA